MRIQREAGEKKILEQIVASSEEFLQYTGSELNYQKITDTILDISGAKYAGFNLYDEDGSKFTTVAVSAPEGIIKKVYSLLGFKLLGKKCENDPVSAEKIKSYSIIHSFIASEYAKEFVSKPLVLLLEKTLNLGEIVFVKICKENVIIGNFTLVMPKNVKLKNKNYIEIYTRLVGLLITRIRGEVKLTESESNLNSVFAAISDPLFLIDQKTSAIIDVNDAACRLYGYSRDEMLKLRIADLSAELEKTRKAIKEPPNLILVRYCKKKDGTVFPVEITTSLFEINGKKVIASSIRDITERKKAEEALQKRENLLSKIFDILPVGLWIADKNGKLIRSNQKGREIWGAEPLIGQDQYGIFKARRLPSGEEIAPDDWALAHSINSGETILDEMLEIDAFDGKKKIILNYTSPVLGEDGKVEAGVIVNLDITKQKIIQDALRTSEEKFAKAFHSSPWVLTITSLDDGKLIEVNDSFRDVLGYSREEAIGHTTLELGIWINPEDRVRFVNILKKKGSIHNREFECRTKSGDIIALLFSAELIDLAGKAHMLTSFYNITERKKAEKLLHESEEKYRTLFETSAEGILIAEIESYKFKYANPAICQMLGYTEKQLKVMDIAAIHPKEYLQSVLAKYQDQVRGIYSLAADIPCLRKDGTIFYADINTTSITIDGQKCTAGFFHDITERKKAEAEILSLSFHDYLTGLYNRKFFEEELKRLDTRRQLPLSFIMGDLNSLKIINDVFGHAEGDELLKETAEILKRVSRSDDILARWGGDEFVLLLPKTSIADSEEIVQRIKKECKKTNRRKIPISLSLGAATKEEAVQDIKTVVLDAESNMYRNKLVEKESLTSSIIFALDQALYEKSNETKEHTDRISELAIKLGKSIKLSTSQLDEISLLATLHDIGKVAVPETILLKEGKLSEKEWAVIKRHPEIGFNIAQASRQISHIAKFILSYHENWDGSGYPLGIKGQSIPVISRIILIVDAYDVMTTGRIYKKTMSKDAAIEELKKCSGTQFDPVLVDKFIEIISN